MIAKKKPARHRFLFRPKYSCFKNTYKETILALVHAFLEQENLIKRKELHKTPVSKFFSALQRKI
jgi:hypothetical protein